jgi:hypothetical protein
VSAETIISLIALVAVALWLVLAIVFIASHRDDE